MHMRNLLFGLAALMIILITQSCKEEINLTGNFKETAVVYGLLDQADSIHMIKINRAFIGPGDALQFAQIPDSNYFNSINATITERIGGSVTRTWNLTDTLIDNKDENGIFYAPQQRVYYFATSPSQPLDPSATYTLDVDVNNGQFAITAQTQLVDGLSSNTSSQNFSFKFSDNPGQYKSTSITCSNPTNAYIINATLRVTYEERINGVTSQKSFDWNLGERDVTPGPGAQTFSANGETFYNLVKSSCETSDPAVDRRRFIGFEVIMTGGAEDLYNYILVNQPSSSLAQTKPTFTNLTATNDHPVIGIFSSRQTLTLDRPFIYSFSFPQIRSLDKRSTQELCQGPITGPFLFCSHHPADNIVGNEEPYACN